MHVCIPKYRQHGTMSLQMPQWHTCLGNNHIFVFNNSSKIRLRTWSTRRKAYLVLETQTTNYPEVMKSLILEENLQAPLWNSQNLTYSEQCQFDHQSVTIQLQFSFVCFISFYCDSEAGTQDLACVKQVLSDISSSQEVISKENIRHLFTMQLSRAGYEGKLAE